MGIYDRSYYREDDHRGLFGGRTMVVNVILFTVACYVAEVLSTSEDSRLSLMEQWFDLSPDLLTHPWRVYQLITCGFMHDHNNIFHLIWNMIGLWFFGREVESIYGPLEFLRIYLTLIVMSSLVWLLSTYTGLPGGAGLEAPSWEAVLGIAMIFTMHFPTKLIYIWGVLPMPVWAMMGLYLVGEYAATEKRNPHDNVAHVAHLAGALFGFIYFRSGWNLGSLVPDRWPRLLRPRLKLHDPDPPSEPRDLSREVDDILAKISREGEASLTKAERRTLEEASKRYQRRRR